MVGKQNRWLSSYRIPRTRILTVLARDRLSRPLASFNSANSYRNPNLFRKLGKLKISHLRPLCFMPLPTSPLPSRHTPGMSVFHHNSTHTDILLDLLSRQRQLRAPLRLTRLHQKTQLQPLSLATSLPLQLFLLHLLPTRYYLFIIGVLWTLVQSCTILLSTRTV